MHKHSLNKLSFLLLGGILLGSYSTANAHWANMNIGTFENKSMSEKLPFGGAFSVNQPDTSELKGRYERRTKLFFGIKDGYWSIAYNDKQPPKGKKTSSNRREFGRFAVTAADEAQNKYTITLYEKLVVGKVIEANSEEISYIVGDELPMKAKDTPPNIPQKGSKDSHKHKDHHQHKDHHKHKDHHQHDE